MRSRCTYAEARERLATMLNSIGRMGTLPQASPERKRALQEALTANPSKELLRLAKMNGDATYIGPLVHGLQELLPAIVAAGAGVPLNFDADALLRDAAARIGQMVNVLLPLCDADAPDDDGPTVQALRAAIAKHGRDAKVAVILTAVSGREQDIRKALRKLETHGEYSGFGRRKPVRFH
jgi:hypothetical protein